MIELNKVFLSGKIASTPSLKPGTDGQQFCICTVTNKRSYKTRDHSTQTETNAIDCLAFSSVAEAMAHCRLGQGVLIEGKLSQGRAVETRQPGAPDCAVRSNRQQKLTILVTSFQALTDASQN